jgi:RimJ/RimL family protein N-acetyltransferase
MQGDAYTFSIPRLRTARLALREPRVEDFESFATSAADAEARVHIGGAIDRREAWRRFLSIGGGWVVNGVGWWVVEKRGEGAVGTVGVFRRDSDPALEIGWVIDRPHWGSGLATEAARAALDHALEVLGDRVVAYIALENAASQAVATKIGMRREAEVDFLESRCFRYAAGRDA